MIMKSKWSWVILPVFLFFAWIISRWPGETSGIHPKEWGPAASDAQERTGNTDETSRLRRKNERSGTKEIKEFSKDELDRYLGARGVNDASMLFVLLNSGDPAYRDLAVRLPDSPLKFMMLSMDVHDDPVKRLEWAEKLHGLDPLNTVSVLRYVSQLMDSGDRKKAAEVLNTVKDCTHASNGYDRLVQEFEFARDFFGEERFGPLAERTVRTWPVRTAHYTVENYLDSVGYTASSGKEDTAIIQAKTKNYLMDIGHFEEGANMTALIQTRMFLSNFRSECTDPDLKDSISKEIAGIQADTDVLFNAGLEEFENVGKHRSAAEDMDYVIDRISEWKTRRADRK